MVEKVENRNINGWDLKILYSLTEQAFKEKNLQESRKLAKIGLSEAKFRCPATVYTL